MAAVAAVAHGRAAAQAADLAGVWILDAAASDTLELEPSDTAQARSSRFRPGAGGWAGGYPPRSRSIRDPERMRDAVDAVAHPAAALYIAQDDSTVTISFDGAQPITLHADGRRVERDWLTQYGVRIRTRWHDRALRIERELPSQVEIRETWTRDGATLTIETVVEGPIPRRLQLKRVYQMERPDPIR
jgi:hypothetical protein